MSEFDKKIAVAGLGCVGLPLLVEFFKQRPIISFALKSNCIAELRAGRDQLRKVLPEQRAEARPLSLTAFPADLAATHQACQVHGVEALNRFGSVFCNLKNVFARNGMDLKL